MHLESKKRPVDEGRIRRRHHTYRRRPSPRKLWPCERKARRQTPRSCTRPPLPVPASSTRPASRCSRFSATRLIRYDRVVLFFCPREKARLEEVWTALSPDGSPRVEFTQIHSFSLRRTHVYAFTEETNGGHGGLREA